MKYNPFRPGNIVGPGMFVGRVDELDAIERALFQVKHGNPQHFLIEGERGIGKSSLLLLAEAVASGRVRLGTQPELRFLAVSIDLSACGSQYAVVQAIGRGLRAAINLREPVKKKALKIWDFLSKWEILGVRFHEGTAAGLEDAKEELVSKIVDLVAAAKEEIDGVFIIVDEADAPHPDARLGEFLKLFTERLVRRDCNSVLLGLAGLPSTIPKLRESHESSPRIFEVLRLAPLTPGECQQVVRVGLNDARKKNNFATEITDDALQLIADLSEGYPHFIQQFAHSAFDEDTDNEIDVADVRQGAFKENGALMQLGHRYFDEMYRARIASEDYRSVLGAMAAHGDSWISRKEIIKESKVSETNVTNALAALRDREIIIADDSRRGYYKLPTKSFAAWINAVRSVADKGAAWPNLFGSGT